MKKILSIITVIALIVAMSTGMCFAGVLIDGVGDVPVTLTVPAVSGSGIDFSVSEGITMVSSVGSTALTISDFTVTNNGDAAQIQLEKIEATAQNGWSIVSDTTDFKLKESDVKEFSMVTEGHDLSTGAKVYAGGEKLAAPNAGVMTVSFTGNIGTFKTPINDQQVAKITPTLSVY